MAILSFGRSTVPLLEAFLLDSHCHLFTPTDEGEKKNPLSVSIVMAEWRAGCYLKRWE